MSDEGTSGLDAVERGPEPSEGQSREDPATPGGLDRAHPTVAALQDRFGPALQRHEVQSGDEHVVFVDGESVREIMAWLKDDPEQRYDLLRDVTAVDYGGGRPIQVVYQLWSIPNRRALRVKCELPLSNLEVPSVTPLWNTANWLEREVYDMFGVEFEGHPDLRRILMPENYAEGHPLRKDFPLRGRFTRAEQTRRALSQDPKDHYIPVEMEIGREAQMAEGTPRGRPELPDESTETPGGVEGSA